MGLNPFDEDDDLTQVDRPDRPLPPLQPVESDDACAFLAWRGAIRKQLRRERFRAAMQRLTSRDNKTR